MTASANAVQTAEAKVVEHQEVLARERRWGVALGRDLASAQAESEALKGEHTRAVMASADAVRAAEAKVREHQESARS